MSKAAQIPASASDAILTGYTSDARQRYDEMLDDTGTVRPHWRRLMAELNGLSAAERNERAIKIDRRVRDIGIAYDIFADPAKPSQQWQLDLVPVVISNAEWRWLEAAVIQRARLFDAVLQDVYGEQALLRNGLLPPELIFSDSAYLSPSKGILPRAGGLQFYAADIARGEDGRWRVIDNHTETLAGIGFALANRVAHTHVAGDIFKSCNGIRLAAHFNTVQSALIRHSGRENARIALLTPGPWHEDYFSHAYVARYLGYLLVEGNDLRTRGNQVYLKTLEGLKEIDLIVRCVDGRVIDPLELDPAAFQGPAGLMRVVRNSPRIVVNPIGSAIAQNRGLGRYIEAAAQSLIGEELLLPDARRRWLGDAERARACPDATG